jgi:hypothetical protein
MSTKIFVRPVTRTPNLNVIAPQGRLSRDRGYLGSYVEKSIGALV